MAPASVSIGNSRTIHIPAPSSGEIFTATTVPGGTVSLGFDPATATINRVDNNLEFLTDEGGAVQLVDFFVVGDQPLPSLTLPDGDTVASSEFLSAFDIDIETAAGPATDDPGSGSGEYADDAGSLIEGIESLTSLSGGRWLDVPWEESVGIPDTFLTYNTPLAMDQPTSTGSASNIGAIHTPQPEALPDTANENSTHPYLSAHDNVGIVEMTSETIVIEAGYQTEKPGRIIDIALPGEANGAAWQTSGKLGEHQIKEINGKEYGLTSSSGDLKLFEGMNFDFESFVHDHTPFSAWRQNGSSVGSMTTEFQADGEGAFNTVWSMYSGSNGKQTGPYDITVAMLFKVGPDGEKELVGHKTLEYETFNEKGSPQGVSGEVSWNIAEGGNYVVAMAVVEAGGTSGNKTILVLDKAVYTEAPQQVDIPPVTEDAFTVFGAGNVIEDSFAPNEESAGLTDSHSEGGSFWLNGFRLNDAWRNADGTAVEWTAGDATYSFFMNPDGSYALHASGKGVPPAIDDLDIRYQIVSDATHPAEASLYLRSPNHVFDLSSADHGGSIYGGDGNDVIYGSEAGDIIYGGNGNDVLHGGAGNDLFVWDGENCSGAGKIMDFSITEGDKLLFENAADEHSIDSVLEDGILFLTVNNYGSPSFTVEVNFQEGELDSFSDSYRDSGATDGIEQALVNAILNNTFGG